MSKSQFPFYPFSTLFTLSYDWFWTYTLDAHCSISSCQVNLGDLHGTWRPDDRHAFLKLLYKQKRHRSDAAFCKHQSWFRHDMISYLYQAVGLALSAWTGRLVYHANAALFLTDKTDWCRQLSAECNKFNKQRCRAIKKLCTRHV